MTPRILHISFRISLDGESDCESDGRFRRRKRLPFWRPKQSAFRLASWSMSHGLPNSFTGLQTANFAPTLQACSRCGLKSDAARQKFRFQVVNGCTANQSGRVTRSEITFAEFAADMNVARKFWVKTLSNLQPNRVC